MIHVEILSSSDPSAIGLYEFQYDQIYLGRSKKNDLIFLDKELPVHYITLSILQNNSGTHLMVKSLSRSPYFFLNGKKVSGALKTHPGDVIAFGENEIKILQYRKTRSEADLAEVFLRFDNEAPELRFALNFIEEVLVELEEKNQHV